MMYIHAVLVMSVLAQAAGQSGVPTHEPRQPARDALEVIPASWIDLPESPFVAALHDAKAVLVNRSEKSWPK